MKVSTLVVVVPVVVFATVVAMANRSPVTFSLDPFPGEPSLALSMPLFLLVFLTFLLGVVLGGVTVWWRRTISSRSSNLPAAVKNE
ncbi:MAG: hypothetical protein V3S07_05365 [Micropepsaceae bacterium]